MDKFGTTARLIYNNQRGRAVLNIKDVKYPRFCIRF